MYYKVEAHDDEIYIEANSLEEAQLHFKRVMGKEVPEEILEWTELEELPEGQIPMTFEEEVSNDSDVINFKI